MSATLNYRITSHQLLIILQENARITSCSLLTGNFSVFNCTREYADGQTMSYRGADGVFENNLWHHNDFTCVGNGFLLPLKVLEINSFVTQSTAMDQALGFHQAKEQLKTDTL